MKVILSISFLAIGTVMCLCQKDDCIKHQGNIIISSIRWESNTRAIAYFKYTPNDPALSNAVMSNCGTNSQFIEITQKDSLTIARVMDSLGIIPGNKFDATWNQNCCPDQFTIPGLNRVNLEIAVWCKCQPN